MQLGGHKTSVPSALPRGLVTEAWWGADLVDVNADTDDWSMCSSLHPNCHLLTALFTCADKFESTPAESAGPNTVGVS